VSACDNSPTLCRANNKTPALPREAYLPINRCNLPAVILGSPTYRDAPMPLKLDGVAELHADLFRRLDAAQAPAQRAEIFQDYMTVHFRLEQPEDAGYNATRGGLEESLHRIDSALAAADLVICQAGCISHNAYWRVKEQCKRTGKPCLFVKRSGVSSFGRVIADLCGEEPVVATTG
jgi:hypothetical protein